MATLIRFREPFREIAALQNEMSRLMAGFFDTDGRTNQAWVPAVDVNRLLATVGAIAVAALFATIRITKRRSDDA